MPTFSMILTKEEHTCLKIEAVKRGITLKTLFMEGAKCYLSNHKEVIESMIDPTE